MASESEEFKSPFGVTYDDEQDHVRVMVVLPGIKKALMKNDVKGGRVDLKVEEISFDLKVYYTSKDSGAKKEQKYRYHVRKLPAHILPHKYEWKVQDGKVMIKIYKAKNESWAGTLTDVGLDTYDEDEDSKEDT